MVKRYFRFSIDSVILQIVTLLFIIASIYYAFFLTRKIIIEFIQGKLEMIGIVVTIVFYMGILLFVYIELTFLIGNICLNNKTIYVCGDIKYGREKLQYPVSIDYVDICSIEIIPLRKNSKNQSARLSRPIPYLVLTNKKGKKYRFGLYFMSKKAVKRLLEELLKKCEEIEGIQFDVEKLFCDFLNSRFVIK